MLNYNIVAFLAGVGCRSPTLTVVKCDFFCPNSSPVILYYFGFFQSLFSFHLKLWTLGFFYPFP